MKNSEIILYLAKLHRILGEEIELEIKLEQTKRERKEIHNNLDILTVELMKKLYE